MLVVGGAFVLSGCVVESAPETRAPEETAVSEVSRVLADPYIPDYFPLELPENDGIASVFSTLPTGEYDTTHTCVSLDGDVTEAIVQMLSDQDFAETDSEKYEDLYSFQQRYTSSAIEASVSLSHRDDDGNLETSICTWYGADPLFAVDPSMYRENFPPLPEPLLDFDEIDFQEQQSMEDGKLTVRHELDMGASTPDPAVQEYGKQYLDDLIAAGWESSGIYTNDAGEESADATLDGLTVRFDFREDRPDLLLRFDWSTDTVLLSEFSELAAEPDSSDRPAPAWYDIAGTWCGVETGTCYGIRLEGAGELVNEYDGLYTFREADNGCFRGLVGPNPGASGGGGAGVLYCPAYVPAPELFPGGDCAMDDDPSRDRLWEFQACGGLHYRQ